MKIVSVGQLPAKSALSLPKHIAIVPNGNRRRAALLGIDLSAAYVRGAQNALECVEWAMHNGAVTDLTLFGLSVENTRNRKRDHLEPLTDGADWFCEHVTDLDCRVHIFGKYEELKREPLYAKLINRLAAINDVKRDAAFTVHIAVNYSGILEHETDPLMDAMEHIAREEESTKRLELVANLRENRAACMLSAGVPLVDLFIRTGGEHRTSGLLPFQAGYAEIKIFDEYWGDFTREMWDEALRWYSTQQRNFGK